VISVFQIFVARRTSDEPKTVTRRKNDGRVIAYAPDDDTPSLLALIITDNTGREFNAVDGSTAPAVIKTSFLISLPNS